MRGPLDLTHELIAADVVHEIVHLRRRIDDARELPEVLGLPATTCLAVRVYDTGTGLAAALLPAHAIPATTALAAALGSRTLRLLPPDQVSAVTDFHPLLVPPLCLPESIRLVADLALTDQEVVYTATGDGGTALKLRTADLLKLTGAAFAPLVEPGALAAPALAGPHSA